MKGLKYILLVLLAAIALFLFNMFDMKEAPSTNITVAFYNVENLFDTDDDPHANDEDFLPAQHWTEARYRLKLERLAEVIDRLGDDNGPEVLGLGEVENDKVIRDLLKQEGLKEKGYSYIHKDSRDRRGIDVALLYKPSVFKPFCSQAYRIHMPGNNHFITRDILLAGGVMDSDTVYFLVNHWPSRLGGEKESEPHRLAAAKRNKKLVDSLQAAHPGAGIIVMGDFNDEPYNRSIKEVLRAGNGKGPGLYNPFYEIGKAGKGTVRFKSEWELLDQIMLSGSFLTRSRHRYISGSADIYDPLWLHYMEKPSNGPFRTFSGKKYYGGYSDHFPVFLQLSAN